MMPGSRAWSPPVSSGPWFAEVAVVRSDMDSTPWYRQFWPWFLIGILAYAVVTGVATVIIATSTSDGLVVDDYYKQGLMINRTLERDRRAGELKLKALVNFALDSDRVRLRLLSGTEPLVLPSLKLELLHPTRNHRDVDVVLVGDGQGDYSVSLPDGLAAAHWHMRITPPDQTWRLQGRVTLPEELDLVLSGTAEATP